MIGLLDLIAEHTDVKIRPYAHIDSRDFIEAARQADERAEEIRDIMVDNPAARASEVLTCELAECESISEEAKALEDECGSEFPHGMTFIPEDQFEDYAQELARDIGAINDNHLGWPNNCIDWERAARELSTDYTSVRIDGEDYYCR